MSVYRVELYIAEEAESPADAVALFAEFLDEARFVEVTVTDLDTGVSGTHEIEM